MADQRVLPARPSTERAAVRAFGWVGLTLALFVAAQIAALFSTSRVTSEAGVGFPSPLTVVVLVAVAVYAVLIAVAVRR